MGSAAPLEPVKRRTLTVEICERLTSFIVRGEWAVGMKLPAERDLTNQMGVGRSSIREALKALEVMGLLESRPGNGTYVCDRSRFFSGPLLWAITSNSDGDVRELIEARRVIETELCGLAAERATADDLKKMGHLLDEMEAGLNDQDRFLSADLEFHLAVAQSAHNRILMNALEMIRNLMRQWIRQALLVPAVPEEALLQHKAIFMGIAKRNPQQATDAMRAHLGAMGERLHQARALALKADASGQDSA